MEASIFASTLVNLSDLWPVVAAVLGPMLLCVTALARYQHVDSVKIHRLIAESNDKNRDLIERVGKDSRDLIENNRDLIERVGKDSRDLIENNRDLIEKVGKDSRDLIENNRDLIERVGKDSRDLIMENRRLIEKNRDLLMAGQAELGDSLADTRERLARIEGYLRILPPPRESLPPSHGDAGDGDARAA